jgi:hypothetical protein
MRRFALTAAAFAVATVALAPTAALAAGSGAAVTPYLAIAAIIVAAISELMPFLPIKDNGIIQSVLHFLNQLLAKKP